MNKKEQRKLLCEIIKEDEKDGLYDLRKNEFLNDLRKDISEEQKKELEMRFDNWYKESIKSRRFGKTSIPFKTN